jgi:hypothetical protein
MDALENVFLPAVLNALKIDAGAELIIVGNLRNFYFDVNEPTSTFKGNVAVGVFGPVLEFPLHFNRAVFLHLDVLTLYGSIIHHVLSTFLGLADTGRLSELTTGHLFGKSAVN